MRFFTQFQNFIWKLVFVMATFPTIIYACSCPPYIPNFCLYNQLTNHVALVTITENIDFHLQEARVLDNINQVIEDEYITLLGQDGLNCGESLVLFDVGDTLVLALIADLETPFIPETYYLDGCGRTYLRYSNNQVTGRINGVLETQDYNVFLSNIEDCLLVSDIDEPVENPVKIYPTFSSNEITIETGLNSMDAIAIYSFNGQLVQQLEGNLSNRRILDVKGLQKGVYFVQVHTGGKAFTEKVVRM